MKVRVSLEVAERKIDEIVEAPNAGALLVEAKNRVAKELGWKGMFLNAMSPISFAQMAVKKYNENFHTDYAIPETAEQFIEFGTRTGNLEVLEP